MTDFRWLEKDFVIRLHDRQIEEHGGLDGIRDEGLLESALARPQNAFHYGEVDVFVLAGMYASGLIGNHPFLDGNKRIGYICALLFLRANGYKLTAIMAERLAMTWQLAAGEIEGKQFADWLRQNCESIAT